VRSFEHLERHPQSDDGDGAEDDDLEHVVGFLSPGDSESLPLSKLCPGGW